ncbi:MAG: glycosyltransferase family 4 protein [Flavobacteriales bacterium]|nr:glycosyltransferase family 4 protein [Flavobacteriales bacterium]
MRVLQLCLKPPQPAKDGGCIAINNISRGLINLGIELKILTLSTYKHPFKESAFDEEFLLKSKIEGVYIDTKVNIVDAFSNLVTSDSYNVSRFFSTDFDILLRRTLEDSEYDIVHLESVFMTTYCHTIRRFSKAKIVLRSHNLEYMIWERLARQSSNPAKKIYLSHLAKQLKNYEIQVISSIDGIAAITDEDGNKYRNLGAEIPIITIPFGINLSDYHYDVEEHELNRSDIRLFHLGAMDWKPNLEGIAWFLEEVWTKLSGKFTNLSLHLAGRNMPEWLLENEYPNLENHGEVSSANDFINSNDVMVVPLLSAGGMRVKIIEGMALGKTVISTKIGAEGINCENRVNILLADTIDEFEEQLAWISEKPARIFEIGQNARRLVEGYYDNESITKDLYGFYVNLIQ